MKDFEEKVMLALRYIRRAPAAVDVETIACITSFNKDNISALIDYMVGKGYIRKDSRDTFDKHDPKARYFTVRQNRSEIDCMIGDEQM